MVFIWENSETRLQRTRVKQVVYYYDSFKLSKIFDVREWPKKNSAVAF